MFILKFIGFCLIVGVIVFAGFLLKAVTKMEAEIKDEHYCKGEE